MLPAYVVPLVHDVGTTAGHRLILLSLEVYDEAADLRFARIDVGAELPLPRRVPPVDAWAVSVDGVRATVLDAVGRGDRSFSNGEVRFAPPPRPGSRLQVRVRLLDRGPNLHATVVVDAADAPATAPGASSHAAGTASGAASAAPTGAAGTPTRAAPVEAGDDEHVVTWSP